MTRSERRDFIVSYFEAALWSSVAIGVPESEDNDSFDTSMQSYGFDTDDIAPLDKRRAMRDCLQFIEANDTLLAQDGTPDQHGHDYWLTRNHHGAGFWDRGYSKRIGDALTKAAHAAGSLDLYVDENNQIRGF